MISAPIPGQSPGQSPTQSPNGEPAGAIDLSRMLRLGGGTMAALFLLSAVVPIGGAVIGTGQVGVETRVKRITHPFGGVVAQLLVVNGEHVREGQVLVRLDDKVTAADARYSNLTVEQLLAQKARLAAEELGATRIAFPAELTASGSDSTLAAMHDEQRLFALRGTEETQKSTQIAARIAQVRSQIVSLEAQIASLRRQRDLIEPERQGIRDLWEKDLVTINRLNQTERSAAEIDGRMASLRAEIAQALSQIAETREREVELRQARRVDAGEQLARVQAALNEQRVRSIAAGDQQSRSEIRAPYSGTVEKVAVSAVGEVIRPAEPIMEIVPDADAMVVETAISPADIDQVQKGQAARVRFTAFNRASTPEFPGTVTYVSSDSSENPESRQVYYMARIAIDSRAVAREGLKLRNGMPAEVHVETGARSMLSYVTKPLRDQFVRAFRDN